jgi:hypothetical protein
MPIWREEGARQVQHFLREASLTVKLSRAIFNPLNFQSENSSKDKPLQE